MRRTLLMIFAFIAFMLGSFIWFVASWDANREEPVTGKAALGHLA